MQQIEADGAKRGSRREVAGLFLRLGATAFGGPAAHIAMFRDEVVKQRKWIDDQHFLDLLGATNLIPGPNSTEMAIHLGYVRAGWRGLIVGGVSFIVPAAIIVTVFAWVYVTYGTLPSIEGILYGIQPVVIAIIMQAIWSLGRKALKTGLMIGAAFIALALYFTGVNEIALLFIGGAVIMVLSNLKRLREKPALSIALPFPTWSLPLFATLVPFSLWQLFWSFFKIGAVLFGSGYVLIAFMHSEFVVNLGWLTEQQLLDAIVVGQVTPGPVFTTATFVGYVMGGLPGALVATVAIFLPSFFFVAVSNPFIPRLRASPWFSGLLDGVNAISLALMTGVTVQLARSTLIDPLTIGLTGLSLVLLLRFKINSTWLIIGGAIIGLVSTVGR
jgi:chromate transporter